MSGFPLPVAVGIPIARHPPHRPVLAHLTHTVPTLDAWRRNEHWGTGEGWRLRGVGLRAAPGSGPKSTDSAGCGGEADATGGGVQSSGTLQGASRYREWRGTESIRPPLTAACRVQKPSFMLLGRTHERHHRDDPGAKCERHRIPTVSDRAASRQGVRDSARCGRCPL